MKLKALIVDAENTARQELRTLLSGYKNIEVVGEAANAQEALALVRAVEYQVAFISVHLPGVTGLELCESIQELDNHPKVVVVSASTEHAFKAFEVSPLDYLVQPIASERLARTVEKLVKLYRLHNADLPPIKLDRLPIEKQGKTILIAESDIFYAYSEREGIYLKTYGDKLMIRFTLKELEARLNPRIFFRTHRCYLVNLYKVREILPFYNNTYNLLIEDEEESTVPVSRAQARKLRRIIGF